MRQVGAPVGDGIGRIPGFVNAYTLDTPEGLVLIDSTMSGAGKPVRKAFERAGQPLSGLSSIVLTHWHPDHVGGAASLHAETNAAVASHAADAPFIDGRQRPRLPLFMRLFVRLRPVPVARTVADGDVVGPLRVVFVPGHTIGEIALYLPERKILFSGDSVVERKGKLTLPAGGFAWDLRQAVASLDRLRTLDVELLLPGHGVPVAKDVPGLLDDLIRRAPGEFLHA